MKSMHLIGTHLLTVPKSIPNRSPPAILKGHRPQNGLMGYEHDHSIWRSIRRAAQSAESARRTTGERLASGLDIQSRYLPSNQRVSTGRGPARYRRATGDRQE